MSAATLVTKIAIVGAVLKFSSGTIEDFFSGIMNGVSVNAAHAQMKLIHGKLMEYYTFHSSYPSNTNVLVGFFKNEFDTPVKEVLMDPWRSSYILLPPHVEILCCGPDKKRNTSDDVFTPYPKNVKPPARFY